MRRASREGVTHGGVSPAPLDPAPGIADPLEDAEVWDLDVLREPARVDDRPAPAVLEAAAGFDLRPEPLTLVAEPDPLPEPVFEPPVAFAAPPAAPIHEPEPTPAPLHTEPDATPAAHAVPGAVQIAPVSLAVPPPPQEMRGADVLVTRTQRMDAVEQYRKLAASLHEARQDRNLRSVLCTSALMGEGKTVTACNLALTLAESYGRSVLLIDADLRRPAVHTMFDIANDEGLHEALRGQEERKLAVRSITPRLSVVTAGAVSSDPMRGLTSARLRTVIEQATAKFDWVIVDTPPVLLLPDARVLVSMVDAVVMVVQARTTPFRTVIRAIDIVRRERVFGVVLNSAEEEMFESYYGSYQAYYTPKRPA